MNLLLKLVEHLSNIGVLVLSVVRALGEVIWEWRMWKMFEQSMQPVLFGRRKGAGLIQNSETIEAFANGSDDLGLRPTISRPKQLSDFPPLLRAGPHDRQFDHRPLSRPNPLDQNAFIEKCIGRAAGRAVSQAATETDLVSAETEAKIGVVVGDRNGHRQPDLSVHPGLRPFADFDAFHDHGERVERFLDQRGRRITKDRDHLDERVQRRNFGGFAPAQNSRVQKSFVEASSEGNMLGAKLPLPLAEDFRPASVLGSGKQFEGEPVGFRPVERAASEPREQPQEPIGAFAEQNFENALRLQQDQSAGDLR